jgi:hypothetical protein
MHMPRSTHFTNKPTPRNNSITLLAHDNKIPRHGTTKQLIAPTSTLRIVDIRHGYWIDPEFGASSDREMFRRILQVDEVFRKVEVGAISCFVVPCLGILLSWASKVIELLRGVGLLVKWVERECA